MSQLSSEKSRFTQLDGLRGYASLVVLLCHTLAFVPSLGVIFTNPNASVGSLEGVLIFSPLHTVWNGTAAVYVFFVLSGAVLVLPFRAAASRFDWLAYYPRRFLRLYLPVWGALTLAIVLAIVFPRIDSTLQSSWANQYSGDLSLNSIARGAILLLGGTELNPAFWSLKWEVLFSALLPLYIFFARAGKQFLWAKVVLIFVIIGVGSFLAIPTMIYLPVFAAGVLVGAELGTIAAWLSGIRRFAWVSLGVFVIVGLNAEWWFPAGVRGSEIVVAVSATVVVLMFVGWAPAIAAGSTRVANWLGKISFSLYLVHLPVLFTVVIVLGEVSLPVALCLGFVLAVIVAEVFYKVVERPSHRISMRVGRRIGARRVRRSSL